ncbi:MAG TPA: alanine racemase [Humibacter sp.]|nr:alanine racemase [Humibacter sp.]
MIAEPFSASRTLSERDKSVPPSAHGSTVAEFLATRPRLSDFLTPVLTLDRGALENNVRVMREWLVQNDFRIAPHGKTTMAPALWRDLMDAGAWGLTVATPWQAGVARAAGIRRIMIANSVVDPVAIRWVADVSRGADEPEMLSWVDDLRTVRLLEEGAGPRGRRIPVIAELGGVGGRTGARGADAALGIARAVAASENLELAGVGGYEGAVGHDRSTDAVARVDAYLDDLRALHVAVAAEGLYRQTGDGDHPIVTAGGSAYLDRVAARLGGIAGADVVLRSGAYQVHDDGYYSLIGPMGTLTGTEPFRSAMHLRARVVSRPEPGLALLDAGRRDLPFDEGLPVPQAVISGGGAVLTGGVLTGAKITAVNDQHAFLRLPQAPIDDLPVGSVVRLGLSHPCTALDKWRLVPVVDDALAEDPLVIDLVETVF